MAQKMIYLSDELMAESKNISNFSELIQKLFRDYLQTKKSKTELLTEAEKLAEEKAKVIAEFNKKEDKIELAVQEVESIEEQTKEDGEAAEHRLANKISNCINNTKDILGIDVTEKQAVDYLNSKEANILTWLKLQEAK